MVILLFRTFAFLTVFFLHCILAHFTCLLAASFFHPRTLSATNLKRETWNLKHLPTATVAATNSVVIHGILSFGFRIPETSVN
jgi:hypothetical protein